MTRGPLWIARKRIGKKRGVPGGGEPPSGDWPTFASTGPPPETDFTIETAGTIGPGTYDEINFVNGLNIEGIDDITLNNCRIAGIFLGFEVASNRIFNNCDFDGEESGESTACGGGYITAIGCRFWNAAQAFNGYQAHLEASFFGELYLTGITHGEGILLIGDENEVFGCSILGNYKPGGLNSDPGGGLSSALSLYNHSGWGPRSNNYVHNNLFQGAGEVGLLPAETGGPVYCVYWGSEADPEANPMTNNRFENNTFRKVTDSTSSVYNDSADIVKWTGFVHGEDGNTCSGNLYEDDGLPVQGNEA